MDFLKTVSGKVIGIVVGGVVTLAIVIAAISWFTMSPAEKDKVMADTGAVFRAVGIFVGWVAIVAVIPWGTFFLISKVSEMRSNAAGALLVLGYTVVEAVVLAWFYGWSIHGALAWSFFAAAWLLAGLYNLLACDWIAEKVV